MMLLAIMASCGGGNKHQRVIDTINERYKEKPIEVLSIEIVDESLPIYFTTQAKDYLDRDEWIHRPSFFAPSTQRELDSLRVEYIREKMPSIDTTGFNDDKVVALVKYKSLREETDKVHGTILVFKDDPNEETSMLRLTTLLDDGITTMP